MTNKDLDEHQFTLEKLKEALKKSERSAQELNKILKQQFGIQKHTKDIIFK